MVKYIITGGAGFIGSHLVEALVKKNKKVNLKTKYFYKFWGIGTQYINLYKTAD